MRNVVFSLFWLGKLNVIWVPEAYLYFKNIKKNPIPIPVTINLWMIEKLGTFLWLFCV